MAVNSQVRQPPEREVAMCKKCHDTGRLPFLREDGTVVPHVSIYCSCHQDEPEHYQDIKPSDMDFPCSDTWRGYYHEQYSGHEPPTVTASREAVREVVIERQPANMLPIRSELKHYQNKLNEHIDAAKKAAEARKKKQQDYKPF